MTKKMLPNWLGYGSLDEWFDARYPRDQGDPPEYEQIRKRLKERAERLLFSLEMINVWGSLEDSDTGRHPDLYKFFWVAMNVELSFEPSPEPPNSEIKPRYTRIGKLASDLRSELRAFADEVGFSPYADMQQALMSRARSGMSRARSGDDKPDDIDLAYVLLAQEVNYPHHGFNDGRFEKALNVLAEASRVMGKKRASRNRIRKSNSPNRMRNEIALSMSKAAVAYFGSPRDEDVASTVNAILNLVEDGEAITGDDVKKLRTAKAASK